MEDKSPIKRFLKDYFNLWFAAIMIFVIFALCIRESKVAIQRVTESQVPFKIEVPYSVKKSFHLFHPIILEAAGQYQVQPALIKAIIMAESGYNPLAISKKGAIGLMQLMPGTAESLGVEDIFDPEHNINAGVKYFRQLLGKFNGNVKLSLAAYNAGTKKVMKYQGIPPFKNTQYYIKKVFEYYQYYKMDMAERIDNA